MTAPTTRINYGRGICPVCNNEYRLRMDGTIGAHKLKVRHYRRGRCSGVGQIPLLVTVASEDDE